MPEMRDPAAWEGRAASLGYQVNHLARLLATLLQREIAPSGVVPGQFAQLLALYDTDGLTPTELSRAVGIEPGTMTKTLQRMERDGLVERRRAAHDGRSVTIHLTDRARKLERSLKAAAARTNARVTEAMSQREVQGFMRAMNQLIAQASRLTGDSASNSDA
jgi:DNA-binding MarR family transcriptional regulator